MRKVYSLLVIITVTLLMQGRANADTVYVNVMQAFFDPATVNVNVGDHIKWTLMQGSHTTTSNLIPAGAAPWNYTFAGFGDSYVYEITVEGTYNYECMFHFGMNGEITASTATTFQLSVGVMDGWNLVSVPGLHPVDQNVNTWWSSRDPLADVYKWNGNYTVVTETAPTEGYWMLHNGAQIYNTGDEWPAGGIQLVNHDPISITTGWNIIGGYENSASVSGLTTTPPGLIVPNTIYGWNGAYANPTNLEAGYGYWLLSNGAGVINPPTNTEGGTRLAQNIINEYWGKITIADASGKQFILYSVNEDSPKGGVSVNLDHYQLPPLPPADAFDVRYSSNRRAENLKEGNQTIDMRGMVYPVTVRVENGNIKLQDETGRIVNARMKDGEEITINNSQVNKLLVSENIIPDVYALEQNYPNPFNPSTVIEFSIPDDAVDVRLTIYDALGQRVTELVNTKLEAGKYKYQWDASNVASGLYIYELRTGKFSSIKKMMLMK